MHADSANHILTVYIWYCEPADKLCVSAYIGNLYVHVYLLILHHVIMYIVLCNELLLVDATDGVW